MNSKSLGPTAREGFYRILSPRKLQDIYRYKPWVKYYKQASWGNAFRGTNKSLSLDNHSRSI